MTKCDHCKYRTECNECDKEFTCEEFLEWIREVKDEA